MLVRMWSKWNTYLLLVEMQTFMSNMDFSVVVPKDEGNQTKSRFCYVTHGHTPKGCFILSQRHLPNCTHCCSIHNSWKLEIT